MRVLVAGTGFAGKGHTAAFRAAGRKIVGMVGRTDQVVMDLTKSLDIPYGGLDWAQALQEWSPDIATIATPGGVHFDQVKQAIAAGCHVLCDKPLTTKGATATQLHKLAQASGIKTAHAASYQFAPSVQHAKRLIADGEIGQPTEIESISHFNLERGIPFGWSHRAEDKGGRLNINFTHSLAIALTLVEGSILQIAGDVRDDLGRAPIVEGVHDFTKSGEFIPADLDDPALEWGESNVEWSYTVLARVSSEMAAQPVSVLFRHGGLVPRFADDHIAIYGTDGAIYLKGHYGSGALFLHDGAEWTELETPVDIAANVPSGLGETEQFWHVLVDRFVRDITGQVVAAYPTFAQGAEFQNIIDVIRRSETWINLEGII